MRKKLIILISLNFFLINHSLGVEPKLGLADFGYICDKQISSKGKVDDEDPIYLGFAKIEDFVLSVSFVEEENEFFMLDNIAFSLGDIEDNNHRLKDVYIWFQYFGAEFPAYSFNFFYYDEDEKKSIHSFHLFKANKAIINKIKKYDKIMKNFYQSENQSDKLFINTLKKLYEIGKWHWEKEAKFIGSPVTVKNLKSIEKLGVKVECKEIN